MIDLCNGNTLNCLNNGQCAADITSNTTYCECASCHDGSVCEHTITRQSQIDTTYVYLIVSIIALFFSLLNNILGLELFIGCSRVRRTNCGIYLIVYSILSVLSSISFVVNQSLAYYVEKIANNALMNFPDYQCYFAKIGYNSLVYACIWLNACIAFERGLIVCFDSKTNATRWRSVCTITVLTVIAGGSAIPMMVYHCDFGNIPSLQTARLFLVWFSTVAGLSTYVLAILLILLSFARRIRRYGTENGSFMKTYLKLFYSHLFIFIPPFAYAFGYIPYSIVINTQDPSQWYFQCGISMVEFIVKVLLESLQGVPPVLTWLLFIYPSKVYMTEYYMNTWSGQRLARIIIFFRGNHGRKQSFYHDTTNCTSDAPARLNWSRFMTTGTDLIRSGGRELTHIPVRPIY
ncbi:unnamed protein product [Rotaria magnacalcarata]|uniref:EGF-like domain-containing protein n=3 Tax=Rotaria magnacalcarata TaxID=392030 RepID=A0A816LVW0_9BILA|nr:unnamed protein product [Rotaria magnacalcarata]CAF4286183.1 unnamed protein product [Rotaria magnacalcarata]